MKPDRIGIWAMIDKPIAHFEDGHSASPAPSSAKRIAKFAARLDELGYSALWIPEGFGRDPLVTCAWLLANTRRLDVATGIANIYARDAMASAAAMRTLNEISDNRFVMGLGVSHRKVVQGVRGHDYSKPISTMRDYVRQMRDAPYDAARAGEPRIVLAALRRRMLELAAECADGAHSYNVTPEHTAAARQTLGPDKMLCVEQKLVLETDPAKARAIARAELEVYLGLENYRNNWKEIGFSDQDLENGGSDRFIDGIVAWGDETALRRRLREHLDAGASHVCFQPMEAGGRVDMRIIELLAPAND